MDNQNNVELPSIELPTTIVTPAVTEKTYDKMWVTNFVVNSENPAQTTLYAILRPYASQTGDILVQAGTEQVVNLTDLFSILNGTKVEPKLTPETITMGGQLMGLAIAFFKAVIADKAQPDPEPEEPIDTNPIDSTQDDGMDN